MRAAGGVVEQTDTKARGIARGDGVGALSLSAFIFNVLDSAGWEGAPNFPPHDLAMFVVKYTKSDRLKIGVLAAKGTQFQ